MWASLSKPFCLSKCLISLCLQNGDQQINIIWPLWKVLAVLVNEKGCLLLRGICFFFWLRTIRWNQLADAQQPCCPARLPHFTHQELNLLTRPPATASQALLLLSVLCVLFALSFRFLPAQLLQVLFWVIPLSPYTVTPKCLAPRSACYRRNKVLRCCRTNH